MKARFRIILFVLLSVICTVAVVFVAALVPRPVSDRASVASDATTKSTVEAPYVVNLASRKKPIDVAAVDRLESFNGHRLYASRHVVGGTTWYRLRLGFFPDLASARRMAAAVERSYPGAWVSRKTTGDRPEDDGIMLVSARPSSRNTPATSTAAAAAGHRQGARTDEAPVTLRLAHDPRATAIRVAAPSREGDPSAADGAANMLTNSALPVASECDELAAHPWDPNRISAGRYWNQVPAMRAVRACETAVRGDASARNMYQYARALAKARRFMEAAQWYKKSADLGYVQAQYAFGDIFEFGEGVETDYREAQKWYQRAVEQGYAHAEKRLVRLREAGLVVEGQQLASIDGGQHDGER